MKQLMLFFPFFSTAGLVQGNIFHSTEENSQCGARKYCCNRGTFSGEVSLWQGGLKVQQNRHKHLKMPDDINTHVQQ